VEIKTHSIVFASVPWRRNKFAVKNNKKCVCSPVVMMYRYTKCYPICSHSDITGELSGRGLGKTRMGSSPGYGAMSDEFFCCIKLEKRRELFGNYHNWFSHAISFHVFFNISVFVTKAGHTAFSCIGELFPPLSNSQCDSGS